MGCEKTHIRYGCSTEWGKSSTAACMLFTSSPNHPPPSTSFPLVVVLSTWAERKEIFLHFSLSSTPPLLLCCVYGGKKVELDLICFMYAWNCFNFFLHSLSDYASACVLRLCAGFSSLFFPAFLMRHPTASVSRLPALSLDFNIAKFSAKNNDLRRDDIEFGSELCTTSLSHTMSSLKCHKKMGENSFSLWLRIVMLMMMAWVKWLREKKYWIRLKH